MKINKRNIIIIGITLIFLIFLCYLFPYTGDDWAWGSSIGEDRLQSFFEDYNGRYAGNIIVMLLTRSNIIKTIVMTVVIWGMAYLSYRIVNKEKISLFVLFIILFFAMSRTIFRQGIVWTAGFTNYAISTFLILIYFYILTLKHSERKVWNVIKLISVFLLAVVNSLFAEHVTIYLVVIDLIILVYERIKNKKINKIVLVHLIGAVIGAILMFTNGAYGMIANDQDGYRSMPVDGISSIFQKISENFVTVYQELITNNVLLIIVLTILLIGIIYKYFKENTVKNSLKIILYGISMFLIGVTAYIVVRNINPSWLILLKEDLTQYFEFAISVIYFICILILTYLCITDKNKKVRILFSWLSISILSAQMFIVQPIGGRCFLPMYVFFLLIALEIYDYLIDKSEKQKLLNIIMITACMFIAVYFSSIFLYIHHIDSERKEYLLEETAKGSKEILLTHLPYEQYLWTATPFKENDIWEDRIKLFYHIPEDVNLKIISLKEWNKIKDNN